jgi:dTDP-glucose pyrophosphorylase
MVMEMDVDGLLLAAGKSTRTAPYFPQKCAVEVLFNGKVKSVLQHQIDMLMPVVKRLYVVVWWQKELLGMLNGVRVLEYEPRGIADVWQRFLNDTADARSRFVLSVNADDLHLSRDYEMLTSKKVTGVSVMYSEDKKVINDSCAYKVDSDMNVVEILGKKSGLKSGWVGTGCYLLERSLLRRVNFVANGSIGEVEPDDVLKQLLNRGETVKAYPVNTFVHVGDVSVLSRMYREAVLAKSFGQ